MSDSKIISPNYRPHIVRYSVLNTRGISPTDGDNESYWAIFLTIIRDNKNMNGTPFILIHGTSYARIEYGLQEVVKISSFYTLLLVNKNRLIYTSLSIILHYYTNHSYYRSLLTTLEIMVTRTLFGHTRILLCTSFNLNYLWW